MICTLGPRDYTAVTLKASRKKLLLALAAFVLFIAGFFSFEHFRGAWGLKRWKAQMAKKGEVLDIDRLAPMSVPMEQNGLGQLVFLSSQLGGLPNHLQPPAVRIVSPGKALVLPQLIEWPGPSGRRQTNVTWVHVATQLASNQTKLDAAIETIRGGVYHPNLYYRRGFSLPLPHLARFKGIAQWLSAFALHDLHQNQPDAAWEKLTVLLTLADAQKDEPLLISQLVRCAVAFIAFNLTWEVLQYDCWSDAQLAELQKKWADYDFFTPMEKALLMERAIAVIELGRIRAGEYSLSALIGNTAAPPPAPSLLSWDWFARMFDVREQVFLPLWRFAWSQQDELNLCQRMQHMLEAHRKALGRKSGAAMLAEVERFEEARSKNPYHFVRCLFSHYIQNGTSGAFRRAWSTHTMREMVVAAVASKRYAKRYHKPPAGLPDLVPEFLDDAPIDYMDGRPLRYCLDSDSTWLLYSIGLDGIDDGGDASPREKSTKPTFQNGRDLVWPQRASTEEVWRLRP